MAVQTPDGTLDQRFSVRGAKAEPWSRANDELEKAELYWLSSARPDGRPHVTPLAGVFVERAFYFCTGEGERKQKNITENAHVTVTTGCNKHNEGYDIVLEGDAVRVTDDRKLQRLADAWFAKYGEMWRWEVRDGMFRGGEGNAALVYEVAPAKVLGFGKGETFSQTSWRF